MYFLSKNGFKFSKKTSILLAFLYTLTPKVAAYLEAGHVGLVYSVAWIPWILLSVILTRTKPNLKLSIIYSIALALLYFSHLPTFLIIAAASVLFITKKSFVYFLAGAVLTFGLISISFLPQITWQKESTRYLLLESKDVYPKWESKIEAVKAIFIPNMNTEKAIVIGFIPGALAFLGFLKLKRKHKVLAVLFVVTVGLIILNNTSPIYSLLLKQDWYLLLRVSTRFWILVSLLSLYLIGLALEKYRSKIVYILALLAVFESLLGGTKFLSKPVIKNPNLASKEVYEYLSKDKSNFRVYCLSRCLSQRESATYGLELLDGYSTVQQKNFYQHAWQLTGTYWNHYTLAVPPFGADTKNPDLKSLGEYNVKYIISNTPITSRDLILKEKIDQYLIYENKLSKSRDYEIYTPNHIKVNIEKPTGQIVLPEVYSPGWVAYLNGDMIVPVLETPSALRAVDTLPDTEWVDLKYEPDSLKKGKYITLTTLLILAGYGFSIIFRIK